MPQFYAFNPENFVLTRFPLQDIENRKLGQDYFRENFHSGTVLTTLCHHFLRKNSKKQKKALKKAGKKREKALFAKIGKKR